MKERKNVPIKSILFIVVFMFLFTAGCKKADINNQNEAPAGTTAPDFKLHDLKGKTVKLKNFRKKTVLLIFWATWCPPCRAEIPRIKELSEKYKGNKNIEIITVSVDEKIDTVKEFVLHNNITYRVLYDENAEAARKYGVQGIPANFVVDSKGKAMFFGPYIEMAEGKIKELQNIK